MSVVKNTKKTFSEHDVFALIESYYKEHNIASHQINSFNDFATFGMQEVVDQESIVSTQNYSVKFGQISISPPNVIEEDRTMKKLFPAEARLRDLSYDGDITVDIIESETGPNGETKEKYHSKISIGRIPIMLKSCKCNLNDYSEDDQVLQGECPNDYGGYFIVKGNERVLVAQMRSNHNSIFVTKCKSTDKYKYSAHTRSMSNETGHSVLVKANIALDDRTVLFTIPFVKDAVPAGVVFKAMGFSDEDIFNLIGLDDKKSQRYIKFMLRDSAFCQTKEDALKYLSKHAKNIVEPEKVLEYAKQIVDIEILPHLSITGTTLEKAIFLAHILKRLFLRASGFIDNDDLDNYANKRVDTAGILIHDIFRNLWKKYITYIKNYFEKRKQRPDIITIISRLKSITKGFHQCFATGNWVVQKNAKYVRTGVSQILDRMTYCATLSHLRRVLIPVGKEGKNVAMRQMHGTSFGFVDPCETPEGQKVGVVLNFALTASVTRRIQTIIVKKIIERVKSILSVNDLEDFKGMRDMSLVLLNGVVMGFSKDADETMETLRKLRRKNILDREVSISYDSIEDVIRIYSDEGRFIRPLLTLTDNRLNIQPLEKETRSYNWSDLIKKDIVRYIDSAEIEMSTIAMTPKMLKCQWNDYCEIHPSVMLGIMSAMIPFPDHSQSPRNCYQCLDANEKVVVCEEPGNIRGGYIMKPIKDIVVGDYVFTADPMTHKISETMVVHQYVRETTKKMVSVKTISQREVRCTEDHPILTWRGWKMAGSLKPGLDKIAIGFSSIEGEYKEYDDDFEVKVSLGASSERLSLERWQLLTSERNDLTFIPVLSVTPIDTVLIADITTASECHSFFTSSFICVHNSSMGKQALGLPVTSYNIRTDTLLHVLQYPQAPLVSTKYAHILKTVDMPSGINAIVAICTYNGWNQEDSVMLNGSSIDRGLFVLTSYHSLDCIEKKRDTYSREEIRLPPENIGNPGSEGYFRRKNANYSLLDEDGIVRKRNPRTGNATVLKKGDVIVGKVIITGSKTGEESMIDASLVVQAGEEGTVDRVYVNITPNGYKLVKIVVRVTRIPILGDKFASREAQKGTTGMILRQEDMPFTASGIVPDIIMNPLGLPSRMTTNQLLEAVTGKKCCMDGKRGDATPFTKNSTNVANNLVKEMNTNLERYGFSPLGWETMYNGMTGEMMEAQIFIGPTYYQRLKHMVDDKLHVRAVGAVTMLTHSPLEGVLKFFRSLFYTSNERKINFIKLPISLAILNLI